MTKAAAEIQDATCQGPGEAGGKCGLPAQAHGLCVTHVQQFYRNARDKTKLRPIAKHRSPSPEARGKISPKAAELVERYGKADLELAKRSGNALYRGTQIVLEALGDGRLKWRRGAEPPVAPPPAPKKPTRRHARNS
jgi:hypothetical protein